MGYYATYEVTAEALDLPRNDNGAAMKCIIKIITEEFGLEYDNDNNIRYAGFYGYTKWSDQHDEMLALSSMFPFFLFTVTAHGEDDCVWMEYFLGGKCQDANMRIVHDEFDRKKLSDEVVNQNTLNRLFSYC